MVINTYNNEFILNRIRITNKLYFSDLYSYYNMIIVNIRVIRLQMFEKCEYTIGTKIMLVTSHFSFLKYFFIFLTLFFMYRICNDELK